VWAPYLSVYWLRPLSRGACLRSPYFPPPRHRTVPHTLSVSWSWTPAHTIGPPLDTRLNIRVVHFLCCLRSTQTFFPGRTRLLGFGGPPRLRVRGQTGGVFPLFRPPPPMTPPRCCAPPDRDFAASFISCVLPRCPFFSPDFLAALPCLPHLKAFDPALARCLPVNVVSPVCLILAFPVVGAGYPWAIYTTEPGAPPPLTGL